jgi:hypothetical protein
MDKQMRMQLRTYRTQLQNRVTAIDLLLEVETPETAMAATVSPGPRGPRGPRYSAKRVVKQMHGRPTLRNLVRKVFEKDAVTALSLDTVASRTGRSRRQVKSACNGLVYAGELRRVGRGIYRAAHA